MPKSVRIRAVISLVGLLIGCTQEPPNIRSQFTGNVKPLGVTPVYPIREDLRMGQIYIADTQASQRSPNLPVRRWISDGVAAEFEKARQDRLTAIPRYASSGSAITVNFNDAAGKFKPDSGDTLELIAMPSYGLASFSQNSVAGSFPLSLSNIGAALGISSSRFVTVEADATEMAELPVDTFIDIVAASCRSNAPNSLGRLRYSNAVNLGYREMRVQYDEARVAFKPVLNIVEAVYYLRAIKYQYNTAEAASAAVQAALNTRLDASRTPPAVGSPTLNAPSAQVQPPPGMTPDQLSNAMKNLTDSMNALTSRLSSLANNNVNIAATFTRTTATGIELVQVFDRPLAFGFMPFSESLSAHDRYPVAYPFSDAKDPDAVAQLCADAGVR
jgi:hypothetical protein